jgi:hypothetical protein
LDNNKINKSKKAQAEAITPIKATLLSPCSGASKSILVVLKTAITSAKTIITRIKIFINKLELKI